ncbi:hypothetical protein D3C81_604170 [compost metagenome]
MAGGRVVLIQQRSQQRCIHAACQIEPRLQRATGCQQCGVAGQQHAQTQPLRAWPQPDRNHSRRRETQADTLQHAPWPVVRKIQPPPCKKVQQQAEAENARRAHQQGSAECGAIRALLHARHHAQRDGYADNHQEEREYQVRRRAAVPFRMQQRRVDMAPAAGIVDQQHCRHGDAPQGIHRGVTGELVHRELTQSRWPEIQVAWTCISWSSHTKSA